MRFREVGVLDAGALREGGRRYMFGGWDEMRCAYGASQSTLDHSIC